VTLIKERDMGIGVEIVGIVSWTVFDFDVRAREGVYDSKVPGKKFDILFGSFILLDKLFFFFF